MEILFDEQTTSGNSVSFELIYKNIVTLIAHNLDGVEEITIQAQYNGTDFVDVYDKSEAAKYSLTATGNIFLLDTPGVYRLSKPATVNPVTVGAYFNILT